MVRARVMEEQLIQLWRKGQGFFWTGGPGEENLNISLSRLLKKGEGLDFDFFHPHYRSGTVGLGMGLPMISFIRQMKALKSDPFTGGKNFVSHLAVKNWNIIPTSSPVATQCILALGTAKAQTRAAQKSLSVCVIGDGSSASPDFASSMIWSSRPDNNLPLLSIITNNDIGISTATKTQVRVISKRAEAFKIKHSIVDGLILGKTWSALFQAFEYVRQEQKPYVLEIKVPRLFGHSSSSGANRETSLACPIENLKKEIPFQLDFDNLLQEYRLAALNEFQLALSECEGESYPDAESVLSHSFA